MHRPVMADRVVEYMNPQTGRVYLDATVGEGGHTRAILLASAPDGRVVGVDRDERSLAAAQENLKDFGNRVRLQHANYRDIGRIAAESELGKFDGIVVDLGFSSAHIDDPRRGFSFRNEGPLDMRYDTSSGMTAYDVVNTFPADKLARILREYGEEKRAGRIVRAIVRARSKSGITSTTELASVVAGAAGTGSRIHPATRTFQAIRIFINNELDNLKVFLDAVADFLNIGGVLVVISFHSLEDRIVKHAFRQLSNFVTGQAKPVFRLLTRKPAVPDRQEQRDNERSRSAKLRAVQRIG